jgi:hypothetical protein
MSCAGSAAGSAAAEVCASTAQRAAPHVGRRSAGILTRVRQPDRTHFPRPYHPRLDAQFMISTEPTMQSIN